MTLAEKVLREKVAVHEAAHAFAFVDLGLTEYMADLHLEVPETFPKAGEVPKEGIRLGHLQLAKQPSFPNGTTDPVELQEIERLCLGYLVAKPEEMRYYRETFTDWSEEQFAGQRWPSGDSDVTGAIQLAFAPRALENLASIRTFIRRMWARARAFVGVWEHWYIIQSLAVELVAQKVIPKDRALLSSRLPARLSNHHGPLPNRVVPHRCLTSIPVLPKKMTGPETGFDEVGHYSRYEPLS